MLWSSPARPKRTTVSCATLHTLAAPHPSCDPDAFTRETAAAASSLCRCCHSKDCLPERNLVLSSVHCSGGTASKLHVQLWAWRCLSHQRVILTVRMPLHASVRPGQTSAPAAQSARSAHQQTMAGAGRMRWGLRRPCQYITCGVVADSCTRPATLCGCRSCRAALPVAGPEALTRSPRCVGPAVATVLIPPGTL